MTTRISPASCHAGAKLTNNATVDVGTGGPLQVPSLIGVGNRAPFMHDGCAKTLADRFNPACGGGDQHGVTSILTAAQIAALVAYMEASRAPLSKGASRSTDDPRRPLRYCSQYLRVLSSS